MDIRRDLFEVARNIVVVMGRVLIGAFAGLILGAPVVAIVLHILGFETVSRYGHERFLAMLGVSAASFALLAVVWGGTENSGWKSATIKGVLAGAVVGVVLGFLLGWVAQRGGGPPKAANMIAVFVIGPLGAIAGGLVAYESKPSRKKSIVDKPSADFE